MLNKPHPKSLKKTFGVWFVYEKDIHREIHIVSKALYGVA